MDRNGQSIWRRQLSASEGYARNPVVRVFGNTIMVAWVEASKGEIPSVWMSRFDLAGKSKTQPYCAGSASANTWNLNATVDAAGTFYVTYDARLDTQENELRLLAITDDGVRDIAISADDGFASVYPDIAINRSGLAALTWFDAKDDNKEVYLIIMPLADLLAGKSIPATRITHTPTPSIGAYLAWNEDRLALVWCDVAEGQQELYLRMFKQGDLDQPIQRLTQTAAQSSIPSVRAHDKGFAIAWNEYQATGHGGHRDIQSSEASLMLVP